MRRTPFCSFLEHCWPWYQSFHWDLLACNAAMATCSVGRRLYHLSRELFAYCPVLHELGRLPSDFLCWNSLQQLRSIVVHPWHTQLYKPLQSCNSIIIFSSCGWVKKPIEGKEKTLSSCFNLCSSAAITFGYEMTVKIWKGLITSPYVRKSLSNLTQQFSVAEYYLLVRFIQKATTV